MSRVPFAARTPLASLALALEQGTQTAYALVAQALKRARDPAGEGARVFVQLFEARSLAQAEAADLRWRAGRPLSPMDGIPISVKDLFDVAGSVTRSGSVVLNGAAPAAQTALALQRLERAGAIIVGRTNMTEFAYSGVGINPHHGTPLNPWDRATGRIPGGSSSGGGVSVADGMCAASIGSDTGGSVRIPAALCGLVGFKPTARRIPMTGVMPLSTHLDSIGPIAPTVACCRWLDAVMSRSVPHAGTVPDLRTLRLAVPRSLVQDGLDAQVASSFQRALSALAAAGAQLVDMDLPQLLELSGINASGGYTAMEAWHDRGDSLQASASAFDPRVAARMEKGRGARLTDLLQLSRSRQRWIESIEDSLLSAGVQAMLMPTTPIVAPVLSELVDSDEAFAKANLLLLRNPTTINFLDGCAVSLPCHRQGEAPVGLMVAGPHGHDAAVLDIAQAIENLFTDTAA